MRVAIYNPYLDTLGGGERYTISFALVMKELDYKVDIQWKDPLIKSKLERRFGLNLDKINFTDDIKKGDGYDICFWVSDGSIPLLHARVNLLHFQFPFKDIKGQTLFNKMKLFRINNIICNSKFTKKFIDEEFGVKSIIVYPPVAVEQFKPKRKENLIVYVGRFSRLAQAKRQDVLIKAFKKFYEKHKDWKLILAGGTEVGAEDYINSLKELAQTYPVKILESPSFNQLKELYGKAKFFWSAAGFDIDEERQPIKVEHFGITIVEAMAAGCIPIVFGAGGHKEIIENGENGFIWNNTNYLLQTTEKLVDDNKLSRKVSNKAKLSSRIYNFEVFKKKISNCLK